MKKFRKNIALLNGNSEGNSNFIGDLPIYYEGNSEVIPEITEVISAKNYESNSTKKVNKNSLMNSKKNSLMNSKKNSLMNSKKNSLKKSSGGLEDIMNSEKNSLKNEFKTSLLNTLSSINIKPKKEFIKF